MKKPSRALAAFALLCFLAGCETYTLVEANAPVTMAQTYTVQPQIKWSKRVQGKFESWTVDGPLIEELSFVNGIESGDSLVEPDPYASDEVEYPEFRSGMTALEIQDLYEATLSKFQASQIATEGLRPLSFGAQPGFRFDFSYVSQDGLKRSGMVVGFVRDEKLYLIAYTAAALHYYDRYKGTVERLVASITIL